MKKPYVVPLPPEVVKLLESKHRGAGNLTQSASWSALKSHLSQTLERMKRWSCHEGLDPWVETAEKHLEVLEVRLTEDGQLEELTETTFRLFGALHEYGRLQYTLRECEIDEVDDTIQALHALKRGRLEWPDLDLVKLRLIDRVDQLVKLFKDGSDHLPEEIQQALLKGFESMNRAVAVMNTRDPEKIDDIAADLSNAGSILEHLDEWQKEFEAENSCEVPVIGREVHELMVELQTNGCLSEASLDLWYNELATKIQEFWGPSRHEFFMPRPLKDRLVGRIDTLLYELQELEHMPPQKQFHSLRDLADAFAEIPTRTFEPEWFENHPQPWLYDTFVAALAGGVPRFQLQWMVEDLGQNPDTYELGQCLKNYLNSEDRDFLLDGLVLMQRESQRNYDLKQP
ncbi:MAG: hypothetical protein WC314_24765 [Vulcanimicrobiota bacterium]